MADDEKIDTLPFADLDYAPTRVLEPTRTAAGEQPPSAEREKVGERVGKILIVDVLGTGGMGCVYSGWDEKLERRVALKSIRRRHGGSQEIKARFLQEAQILSRLQHPNICQIYDYIEGEDSDYLVLELIEGRTLSALEPGSLDAAARLRLALQLADVLAAAHEADVVHRDLKPANVMVTPGGDAKMLDFGIASSVSQRRAPIVDRRGVRLDVKRSDSAVETEAGFVIGTPRYMSPEQAKGEKATPASDMYSFGLLLQELFTDGPAYDPSMSTIQLLAAVQEGRTEPVEGVAPELTVLIERLKSPAPGARPSARDAAERLEEIRDAPMRRRQHRLRLAAIVGLALIAVAMTFQAFRIRQESNRAQEAAALARQEAATTHQVLDFMFSIFEASNPWLEESWKERGRELTVGEVLERSVERMETELSDQPLIRARLQNRLGVLHGSLGLMDEGRRLLETSLENRRAAGAGPLAEAESLFELGLLTQIQGDFEVAEQMQRRSLELRSQAGAPPAALAQSQAQLGYLLSETGRPEEAERLLTQALELHVESFGEENPRAAEYLHRLGNLDEQQGRLELAEQRFRKALSIRERVLGPEHPKVARTLNALGIALDQLRRLEEALAVYRRALAIMEPKLPADDQQLISTRMNIGIALSRQGDQEGAAAAYVAALEGYRSRLGERHPRVGDALGNLGVLRINQGRLKEGRELIEQARGIFEEAYGAEHPSVAVCLATTAGVDRTMRNFRSAAAAYQRALEIFGKTLGPEHPEVAKTSNNLAFTLIDDGRLEEARRFQERALTVARQAFGDSNPETAIILTTAALLERREGHLEGAAEYLAEAREIMGAAEKDGRRDQQMARLLREEANLARDRGDLPRSLALHEEAAVRLTPSFEPDHKIWIHHWQDHASALRLAGRNEEAAALDAKAKTSAAALGFEL